MCVVCVCIGRGCLCSLRGTIIAGNPFHGRTNLFFAGVTPSLLPPLLPSFSPSRLPPFSLLSVSSAGFLPPSLPGILQRSLLHSSLLLATLTSVLPYPPLLSCPHPFHGANLITRRIKADMFTPPCPFENQTNNERLRVFRLPTSSMYPLSTAVPVMRQCKGMGTSTSLPYFLSDPKLLVTFTKPVRKPYHIKRSSTNILHLLALFVFGSILVFPWRHTLPVTVLTYSSPTRKC